MMSSQPEFEVWGRPPRSGPPQGGTSGSPLRAQSVSTLNTLTQDTCFTRSSLPNTSHDPFCMAAKKTPRPKSALGDCRHSRWSPDKADLERGQEASGRSQRVKARPSSASVVAGDKHGHGEGLDKAKSARRSRSSLEIRDSPKSPSPARGSDKHGGRHGRSAVKSPKPDKREHREKRSRKHDDDQVWQSPGRHNAPPDQNMYDDCRRLSPFSHCLPTFSRHGPSREGTPSPSCVSRHGPSREGTPSPSPVSRHGPSREGTPSPSPVSRHGPSREGTPSPSPVSRHGPSREGTPSPSPVSRNGPSREGTPSPSPVSRNGPSREGTPSPSPVSRHGPSREGTPSPSPVSRNGPSREGTPSPSPVSRHGPSREATPSPSRVLKRSYDSDDANGASSRPGSARRGKKSDKKKMLKYMIHEVRELRKQLDPNVESNTSRSFHSKGSSPQGLWSPSPSYHDSSMEMDTDYDPVGAGEVIVEPQFSRMETFRVPTMAEPLSSCRQRHLPSIPAEVVSQQPIRVYNGRPLVPAYDHVLNMAGGFKPISPAPIVMSEAAPLLQSSASQLVDRAITLVPVKIVVVPNKQDLLNLVNK